MYSYAGSLLTPFYLVKALFGLFFGVERGRAFAVGERLTSLLSHDLRRGPDPTISPVEHAFYASWVGGQKRYADGNARRRFIREAEAHALIPRSLSDAERGADPVQRGAALPVKVWIDYGNATVQVLALAVAWSRRCVCVIWTDRQDRQQEAWVWAGAVERVNP